MAKMFAIRCGAPVSCARFLLVALLCSLLIGASLGKPAPEDGDEDSDSDSDSEYEDEPPTATTSRPPSHHHHAHVHKKAPSKKHVVVQDDSSQGKEGDGSRASFDHADHEPSTTNSPTVTVEVEQSESTPSTSKPTANETAGAEQESRAAKVDSSEPVKVQTLLVPLGLDDDKDDKDDKDSTDDYDDYDGDEPLKQSTPKDSDASHHASTTTATPTTTTVTITAANASISVPSTTGKPKQA